jgi:signal transduction histidine kinase
MSETPWPHRPPPELGSPADVRWTADVETLPGLTALRRRLRTAVTEGFAPVCAEDDDAEWLLLVFEELTSNALRHGRPPVQVSITTTTNGWLLDVGDAAPGLPPTPAVERDPREGGLGLHLVARLCASHGWLVEEDRKHVWGLLVCTARGQANGVGDRIGSTAVDLTTSLPSRPLVHVTGPVDDLREDMVTDLFAVLLEALTNVVRHARARTVSVSLVVASGTVTLEVVDNGVGMQGAPRNGGLADLRRRATWHGGTLAIGPGTGSGTRLTWSAPVSWRPSRTRETAPKPATATGRQDRR